MIGKKTSTMNTPIIITLPSNWMDGAESKVAISNTSPAASTPTRKRRLDNLSWEEKMQRKKLKNRVAAQTSRDRKKAKMDDMEQRIGDLEESNKKLLNEMDSLRALNDRLMEENEKLRTQASVARRVADEPARPAVSAPQQKGASTAACRLLTTMCLLSQILSPGSIQTNTSMDYKNLPKAFCEKLKQKVKEHLQIMDAEVKSNSLETKWWGPHQSNWNPVEVKT